MKYQHEEQLKYIFGATDTKPLYISRNTLIRIKQEYDIYPAYEAIKMKLSTWRSNSSRNLVTEDELNKLNRNFKFHKKNSIWLTDVSYMINSAKELMYRCSIQDLGDRKLKAVIHAKKHNSNLILNTFKKGIKKLQNKRSKRNVSPLGSSKHTYLHGNEKFL